MILLFHIAVALVSIAYTTYLYFSPSDRKFRIAEGLVLLTLASGTYLVFSTATNLLNVCMTGLVYLAVVSVGLLAARNKLANTL